MRDEYIVSLPTMLRQYTEAIVNSSSSSLHSEGVKLQAPGHMWWMGGDSKDGL